MKAIDVDCSCGALAGVMCAGGKLHAGRVRRARYITSAERSGKIADDKRAKDAIDKIRGRS